VLAPTPYEWWKHPSINTRVSTNFKKYILITSRKKPVYTRLDALKNKHLYQIVTVVWNHQEVFDQSTTKETETGIVFVVTNNIFVWSFVTIILLFINITLEIKRLCFVPLQHQRSKYFRQKTPEKLLSTFANSCKNTALSSRQHTQLESTTLKRQINVTVMFWPATLTRYSDRIFYHYRYLINLSSSNDFFESTIFYHLLCYITLGEVLKLQRNVISQGTTHPNTNRTRHCLATLIYITYS
jgi:hypothetical protein